MSEIIICPKCFKEIDLHYESDGVVYQSICYCKTNKKLDRALEVLNEKLNLRFSEFSERSFNHSKK